MPDALLQNHPGHRRFPVRYADVSAGAMRTMPPLRKLAVLIGGLLLTGGVAIGAGMVATKFGEPDFLDVVTRFWPVWLAIAIGLALGVVALRAEHAEPAREQARYYAAAGIGRLPDRERAALALNGMHDFHAGFWSETLEYYPLAARCAGDRRPFRFLDPQPAETYLQVVHEDYEILSAREYRDAINSLFDGLHSQRFGYELTRRDAEGHLAQHLAQLIGKPQAYVAACLRRGAKGEPPALVWGFDLWRVVILARNAFMAGLIDETEAWGDILRAADTAYQIFDGFEAFNDNARLGHAYWSRSFEDTRLRQAWQRTYAAECRWPIRALPWPQPGGVVLPPHIRDGFAAAYRALDAERAARGEDDEAPAAPNIDARPPTRH